MALSKQQKTKIIINLSLSILFLIGMLIALYLAFLSFKIDLIYFVVFAIITILATSIGSYGGIRKLSAGKDIYSYFEFKWKVRHLKILFWFISPLTLFIFVYIYSIPVVFLTWLLSLPFEGSADRYSDVIHQVNFGTCIIFALFTLLWLWRLLKRNYFNKELETKSNASVGGLGGLGSDQDKYLKH